MEQLPVASTLRANVSPSIAWDFGQVAEVKLQGADGVGLGDRTEMVGVKVRAVMGVGVSVLDGVGVVVVVGEIAGRGEAVGWIVGIIC